MKVTIYFADAPGPKQFTAVTMRIDTEDFVDALAQAMNQAFTITTVRISKITIETPPR